MIIYIAASWKHQLAVEMLTKILRNSGHHILSFVENNYGEGNVKLQRGAEHNAPKFNFDEWCMSDLGERSFMYDTGAATGADCVIYIGPSGLDAWAEIGAAWAKGRPVIAMHAKGEQVGLMRRMCCWVHSEEELLERVAEVQITVNAGHSLYVDRACSACGDLEGCHLPGQRRKLIRELNRE